MAGIRTVLMAAAMLALAATTAVAANGQQAPRGTLVEFQGKVYINTGKSFQPARLQQPVKAGTRIFVGTEALASVAFPDCTLTLAPGKVHTITATPCAATGDLATDDDPGELPSLRNTHAQWDGTLSPDLELATATATPVPANYTSYAPMMPGIGSSWPGIFMVGGVFVGMTGYTFFDILEEPVSGP